MTDTRDAANEAARARRIAELVDQAPPFTEHQRFVLVEMLRPRAVRPVADAAA